MLLDEAITLLGSTTSPYRFIGVVPGSADDPDARRELVQELRRALANPAWRPSVQHALDVVLAALDDPEMRHCALLARGGRQPALFAWPVGHQSRARVFVGPVVPAWFEMLVEASNRQLLVQRKSTPLPAE